MSEIQCSRCGRSAEALEKAPLPGEVGEQLLSRSCKDCWQEWLLEQVKLINEQQLTPANPEHYELLVAETRKFLKLVDEG